MNKILKKLVQSEKGNVAVIVGFSLTGLLIVSSLVLDMGRVYMAKSHLQTSANSAALSGAQSLPDKMAEAKQIAEQLMDTNDPDSQVTVQVEEKMVTVTAERDMPLFLGRFAGIDKITVGVVAKAKLEPIVEAEGAAPIGVNEKWYSEEIKKGNLYNLTIEHPDIGYTGILGFGGEGGENYRKNLANGYSGTVAVNDEIPTEHGNKVDPTWEAMNPRLDQCPSPPNTWDNYDRDCKRVLLVPTYLPIDDGSGTVKSVIITGFASFFVEEVVDGGKAIKGRFVNHAGWGSVDGSKVQKDTGAYDIRLVR